MPDPESQLRKLHRRLERERKSRLEAEAIAERGLRDLYGKQRQLEVLERIGVAANASASVRDVISFAIHEVCRYTGWAIGHAYLTENTPQGERLVSAGILHTENRKRYEEFCLVSERMQFERGIGLPGRVLVGGTPAWIVDVGQDTNFPRAPTARRVGLKAAFGFPVLAGNDVAAVLEFFSDKLYEPDEVLLRLMAQVGTQLGRVVERKRTEQLLIHNATHDALTRLPNRVLFLDRLNQVIARRQRDPDFNFAVMFLDLDHFKVVNDSLGHHAGDALIVEFAKRVSALLLSLETLQATRGQAAAQATLARLGGDEFLVLLADIRDPISAGEIANKIQDALEQPFCIEGKDVYASASIGVVANPDPTVSANDVMRNADIALYRAKALGKSRYVVFDQTMHMAVLKRLTMESQLRNALRKDEFVLHYQPIVCIPTSQIVGFEALVRWRKNGKELVYPGEFIDVAEEVGIILPLGMWVMATACRTMRKLHLDFPQPYLPYVSINLSLRQFSQPDLVSQIAAMIENTGIAPASVRLEITESAGMVDAARTERVLSELRAIGVGLAMDDFGTGYSSLSQLQNYPLDLLKIDRSFVARMSSGTDGLQIVQTIVNLAKNLRMKVVAEGVETEAQAASLKSIGCDLAQGYLYSRPVGELEVRRMLAAQHAKSALVTHEQVCA